MVPKNYIEKKLVDHFKGREFFSREEVFNFYKQLEPDLKEGTLGWRIYDLKKKHIIKDIGKGIYSLDHKQHFRPEPDQLIRQIADFLSNSFTHHTYNIWTTAWLNDMTELQATSFLYILEVDKESMHNVFYALRDHTDLKNLFLKPDNNVIETYISETSEAIVIEPMITRAPTTHSKSVVIPTLEKILVDLYCDEKLFFAYQGHQLVKIYEVCLDKYLINFSRMLSYAKRRKREDAIKAFLTDNTSLYSKIKEIIE